MSLHGEIPPPYYSKFQLHVVKNVLGKPVLGERVLFNTRVLYYFINRWFVVWRLYTVQAFARGGCYAALVGDYWPTFI